MVMATYYLGLRLPKPLNVTGSNVAESWYRFRDQWENYVLTADLSEAEKNAQPFSSHALAKSSAVSNWPGTRRETSTESGLPKRTFAKTQSSRPTHAPV